MRAPATDRVISDNRKRLFRGKFCFRPSLGPVAILKISVASHVAQNALPVAAFTRGKLQRLLGNALSVSQSKPSVAVHIVYKVQPRMF
jgi:hypothetical protein